MHVLQKRIVLILRKPNLSKEEIQNNLQVKIVIAIFLISIYLVKNNKLNPTKTTIIEIKKI